MARAGHLRAGVLAIALVTISLLPPTLARAAASDALLITTVATGGSSASDEYVVIEAVGAGGANVADYEVIYTTATGATTRRIATLEGAAPLGPGSDCLSRTALGVLLPVHSQRGVRELPRPAAPCAFACALRQP